MTDAITQPAASLGAARAKRAAEVIIDALAAAGVEVVFGLPGGTIAPLHDALLDRGNIRVVNHHHEAGAMFAAAGYAWATGKLGVVLVTSGPGVINTLTGLASASCEGLPVLVLAGEVPRNLFGRGALQEGSAYHLDVLSMARSVTKFAGELTAGSAVGAVVQRAIATAMSGRRGPALLTVPLDVSTAVVAPSRLSRAPSFAVAAGGAELELAARALGAAERPIVFAGSGARWGAGPERLRELAERACVPVMTTPKGKGVFPESHPLSLGVFGHGGHPSTTRYLEEGVDLVLAVGTSLGDPATNGWSRLLASAEHFIQIDVDARQLGRNYPVSLGLIGAAEDWLGRLAHATRPAGERRTHRSYGVSRFPVPARADGAPITPQAALGLLQARLPADTLFTCDIGEHLLFATHHLRIDAPRGFLAMTGLASMGSGIGASLGACLAGRRPVVAICGDGGFAMSVADVATAAQERLPVLFAVLDDRRYGMVELGNQTVYGRTPSYSTEALDIAELARGAGARGLVVETAEALGAIDLAGLLAEGPLVLDIRVDPSVRMPKNERFSALKSAVTRELTN